MVPGTGIGAFVFASAGQPHIFSVFKFGLFGLLFRITVVDEPGRPNLKRAELQPDSDSRGHTPSPIRVENAIYLGGSHVVGAAPRLGLEPTSLPPWTAFSVSPRCGTTNNAQAQPLGVASRAAKLGGGLWPGRAAVGKTGGLSVEWGTTVEHTEWGACAEHARLQLNDNDD